MAFINKKAVGQRIAEAARDKGMKDYKALAQRLRERAGPSKNQISDEAVRTWEVGKQVPSYNNLALLSLVLGEPGEWILFGVRQDGKIHQERRFLDYVSDEEMQLLNELRHTHKDHRGVIMDAAQAAARRYPADRAPVHAIRPKGGS